MTEFTPGPWEYVPSTEYHGPYVTSNFGNTICDLYVMSNPTDWSVGNGGTSKPNSYLAEMADPNARLIAAAPEMLKALKDALESLEWRTRQDNPHWDGKATPDSCIGTARAAIAKATGEPQ